MTLPFQILILVIIAALLAALVHDFYWDLHEEAVFRILRRQLRTWFVA